VVVKAVTNQNRIEDNETVPLDELAPRLVAEGASAAAAVGLRLAGVDVVTPDLGRPLAEAGGRVIEVNGMPGLNHHYNVADPARAVPVAVPILATLLGTTA
jgi:cyanophycin synthetase